MVEIIWNHLTARLLISCAILSSVQMFHLRVPIPKESVMPKDSSDERLATRSRYRPSSFIYNELAGRKGPPSLIAVHKPTKTDMRKPSILRIRQRPYLHQVRWPVALNLKVPRNGIHNLYEDVLLRGMGTHHTEMKLDQESKTSNETSDNENVGDSVFFPNPFLTETMPRVITRESVYIGNIPKPPMEDEEIAIIEEYSTQTKVVGDGNVPNGFNLTAVETVDDNSTTSAPNNSSAEGVLVVPSTATTPITQIVETILTPGHRWSSHRKHKSPLKRRFRNRNRKNSRQRVKEIKPKVVSISIPVKDSGNTHHIKHHKIDVFVQPLNNDTDTDENENNSQAMYVHIPQVSPAPAPRSADVDEEFEVDTGSIEESTSTMSDPAVSMRQTMATDWQIVRSLTSSQFSWVDVIIAISVSVAALLVVFNGVVLLQYWLHKKKSNSSSPTPLNDASQPPQGGSTWCLHMGDFQVMRPSSTRGHTAQLFAYRNRSFVLEPQPNEPVLEASLINLFIL